MRAEGLEPPRAFAHRHLKPARLPISPRPRLTAAIATAPDCMVRNVPPVRRPPAGLRGRLTRIGTRRRARRRRLIVIVLLLISVALMLLITIGGWTKLEGLKAVNFVWCLVYLSWPSTSRGGTAACCRSPPALAILLLILAVIAGTGLARHELVRPQPRRLRGAADALRRQGPQPGHAGRADADPDPGAGAPDHLRACSGFAQGWNVEQEVPAEEAKRRGGKSSCSARRAGHRLARLQLSRPSPPATGGWMFNEIYGGFRVQGPL